MIITMHRSGNEYYLWILNRLPLKAPLRMHDDNHGGSSIVKDIKRLDITDGIAPIARYELYKCLN